MKIISARAAARRRSTLVGLLIRDALDAPSDPWTVCAAACRGGAPPGAHSPIPPSLRRPAAPRGSGVAARGRPLKSAAARLAALDPAGPLLTARSRFADCGSKGCAARELPVAGRARLPHVALASRTPAQHHNRSRPSPPISLGAPDIAAGFDEGLVSPGPGRRIRHRPPAGDPPASSARPRTGHGGPPPHPTPVKWIPRSHQRREIITLRPCRICHCRLSLRRNVIHLRRGS